MSHPHPRTERDLRDLAVGFTVGTITRALPERLECLAAWHRLTIEAQKAADGKPHGYEHASKLYDVAIARMLAAGVAPSVGEYTLSPCMGPDAPVPS